MAAVLSETEDEPTVWIAEYAKSGRSKCKKTKEVIPKGTCRVGKSFTIPGRDFRSTYWYHGWAFPVPKSGLAESDFQGFDELKEKDKVAIRDRLANPKKRVGTKRKSSTAKKGESKNGGGRSSKRICRLPPGWRDMKAKELKLLLAERNLKVSGNKADKIELLEEWERVLETLDPRLEKEERKKYQEYEEYYSGMTNNEMKAILKINDQKMSGKKLELIERCADGKLYGGIPKCEECGGGRLQVNYPFPFGHKGQGNWFCKGYYDDGDFQPCFRKTTDIQEREAWKETEDSDEEAEPVLSAED